MVNGGCTVCSFLGLYAVLDINRFSYCSAYLLVEFSMRIGYFICKHWLHSLSKRNTENIPKAYFIWNYPLKDYYFIEDCVLQNVFNSRSLCPRVNLHPWVPILFLFDLEGWHQDQNEEGPLPNVRIHLQQRQRQRREAKTLVPFFRNACRRSCRRSRRRLKRVWKII
ncbi:uncharacterized protein LOC134260730 [Saccostrea cucullata]|uniref:uncharacterized protein LOC134260730 n=1 Tax=Saccostrea cuccullata TaxID=36930 RepID=UPI002ED36D64